jgi:hypothetical protein
VVSGALFRRSNPRNSLRFVQLPPSVYPATSVGAVAALESQAQADASESWPIAPSVAALVAGICYILIIATIVPKEDYWPRRYLFFKLGLVAAGYAAVLLMAFLPRTRRFAAAVALGLALTSPVALIFSLGTGVHRWDPPVLLVNALAATVVQPHAIGIGLWLFLLSNLALLITSRRRSRPSVPVILRSAAYMFSTLPGIESFTDYESSRMGKAHALSNDAPPVLYKIHSC